MHHRLLVILTTVAVLGLAGCAHTPEELRADPNTHGEVHVDVPFPEATFHYANHVVKCVLGTFRNPPYIPKVRDAKPGESVGVDIYRDGYGTPLELSVDLTRNTAGGTDIRYFASAGGAGWAKPETVADWARGANRPCARSEVTNEGAAPRAASARPLVPVNLHFGPVDVQTAGLVERIAHRLRASGTFAQVDIGGRRWAHTLVIQFDHGRPAQAPTAASVAKDVLTGVTVGLTAGLLPTQVEQHYELKAAVVMDGLVGRTFSFEADDKLTVGVLADDPAVTHSAIADRLLDQLLASLVESDVMPQADDPSDHGGGS
ncbi:MAG: hypothetical protein AB7P42_21990 [Gammaproteobacteria bacterium]